MRIALLDRSALPRGISLEPLETLGEIMIYEETAPLDSFSRLVGVDVVLTSFVPITRPLLDWAPRIKAVVVLSGKPDLVDMVAAADLGVRVSVIMPDGEGDPIEHIFQVLKESLR